MLDGACISFALEPYDLSVAGKNLFVWDHIFVAVRQYCAAFGTCAGYCGNGHHLACKKTLQTMEKFGTMGKENSVR